MGRNAEIKQYKITDVGQPIELFESKRGWLPVLERLLASPWIVRASELMQSERITESTKRVSEDVTVIWDAERQRPASFSRAGHAYRIEAVVQEWSVEKAWWNRARQVSQVCWRVQTAEGVFDLAYDRADKAWRLVGIQD